MNRSRHALALMAGIAACSWMSVARAEVLVAQTRTSPAIYGGAAYSVDFNGGAAGGTQFQFTTTQPNTRVVIFFNAECAVEGSTTRWVDVDILVNPAGAAPETVVAPSNGDNALCSGNGTSTASSGSYTLDGWVSAATIGTINLPVAGSHSVRVRVNGGSAGITRLDDMSLIVMR